MAAFYVERSFSGTGKSPKWTFSNCCLLTLGKKNNKSKLLVNVRKYFSVGLVVYSVLKKDIICMYRARSEIKNLNSKWSDSKSGSQKPKMTSLQSNIIATPTDTLNIFNFIDISSYKQKVKTIKSFRWKRNIIPSICISSSRFPLITPWKWKWYLDFF